jgi:ketosteroid isomerase-like protein
MGQDPAAVVERLMAAVNAHDLDALAACFARDYRNETPAHPRRGFRGREQVRRNWAQLFTGVPDLRARVLGTAAEGGRVWTEWELAGTRRDGAAFALRGVVIFGVGGGQITSARFYLEPVEETSGDVDAQTARVAGAATGGAASP